MAQFGHLAWGGCLTRPQVPEVDHHPNVVAPNLVDELQALGEGMNGGPGDGLYLASHPMPLGDVCNVGRVPGGEFEDFLPGPSLQAREGHELECWTLQDSSGRADPLRISQQSPPLLRLDTLDALQGIDADG